MGKVLQRLIANRIGFGAKMFDNQSFINNFATQIFNLMKERNVRKGNTRFSPEEFLYIVHSHTAALAVFKTLDLTLSSWAVYESAAPPRIRKALGTDHGPTLDNASVVPINQLEATAIRRAGLDTIFSYFGCLMCRRRDRSIDRQSKIAMKLPHGAAQMAQDLIRCLERHACHNVY